MTLPGGRSFATRFIDTRPEASEGADYSGSMCRHAVPGSHDPSLGLVLDRIVRVGIAFSLVFQYLAIELVDQQVDRRVQVGILAFAVDVLAAHVQRHFSLLPQLVHCEDHVRVDHVVEMPDHASKLGVDVLADRRGDVELVAADVEVHASTPSWVEARQLVPRAYSALLCRTGGIRRDSRYFAIVRRATTIPCLPRMRASCASESGVRASSAATSWRINARIAVADAAPPVSVATWLPKKYFSSKVPRGVAMYFCVVTREMVLSWSDSVCAISRSTSGRMATSPC